jgi:uncharacterized protein YbbC (DUF1343 family)
MTNPTGIDHRLRSAVDILHADHCLTALLACEHGVRGDAQAGAEVGTCVDPDTGVIVHSVYGRPDHRPTEEMLAAFDVLVYDIQDVGARFYTYLYSLSYAMEACARAGKEVVVLDRVNPLGGARRAGTILDLGFRSFVGDYELPTQYGLTVGEYARYVKDYLKLDLELTVVPLQGWTRNLCLDDTDLPWVAPSPNCHAFSTALVYPGTCIFEGTNLSEGRGTTLPFEVIGAPWVDAAELERRMNALDLPGLRFRRTAFRPTFSKHADTLCHGVQMHVTDRQTFDAFHGGLKLLEAVRTLHPQHFQYVAWGEEQVYAIDKLLGTDQVRLGALTADEAVRVYAPGIRDFSERAEPYLLYR